MGGNGKHRWKFSIHTSSSNPVKKDPPNELICPISGSLMADPVVVSSGQTFDRSSVQVCRELGFKSTLPDGSNPDFTNLIPNLALKKTILNWCDTNKIDHPRDPDYTSVVNIVRELMAGEKDDSGSSSGIRVSERVLLQGVADKPVARFSHASTDLNPRAHRYYSSSSEESVIANLPPTPLLPFTTRPACFSSPSSTSTSSDEQLNLNLNPSSISEDEEFFVNLQSVDVYEQEQGVIGLRKVTRTNEKARVSLCTPRILSALRLLMFSRYTAVQTNATAAVVNLSLEKDNKVKIVRSGIVPALIDTLKGGSSESQEHAAGAIFSLALDDDNKTAIGVLGGLQPLMHSLRSESERTRNDSALALYHLSLVQTNRMKLIKLGAVSTLLPMLRSEDLAGRLLLVVCNLAACVEGRSAMMVGNAVECLVGMLRKGESESIKENCVAALYSLSQGSMRFKGLAREARLAEALRGVVESGSERAREKGKRMLVMLRGRDEEDEDDDVVDWDNVIERGVGRNRYGGSRNLYGANSTEF